MSKIIGIDLGTTNSVVAVMEGGEPVVITKSRRRAADALGRGVYEDRRAPGRPGRQAASGDEPRDTVFSIKRFMAEVRRGQ